MKRKRLTTNGLVPRTMDVYDGCKLSCSRCKRFLGLHKPGSVKPWPSPPECEEDLDTMYGCEIVEFLMKKKPFHGDDASGGVSIS